MLNKEWKKSFDLRERNLRQSSDKFPYHVIFLESVKTNHRLVGHARITKVLSKPEALYLSSVVIKEERRGQGLGKKFMQMIADHVQKMGYNTIYLRTDLADFYVKCGYAKCDPVQEVVNVKMEERLAQLSAAYGSDSNYSYQQRPGYNDQSTCCPDVSPQPQIPPAPPVPKVSFGSCKTLYHCVNDECSEFQCQFWMKKFLT